MFMLAEYNSVVLGAPLVALKTLIAIEPEVAVFSISAKVILSRV